MSWETGLVLLRCDQVSQQWVRSSSTGSVTTRAASPRLSLALGSVSQTYLRPSSMKPSPKSKQMLAPPPKSWAKIKCFSLIKDSVSGIFYSTKQDTKLIGNSTIGQDWLWGLKHFCTFFPCSQWAVEFLRVLVLPEKPELLFPNSLILPNTYTVHHYLTSENFLY